MQIFGVNGLSKRLRLNYIYLGKLLILFQYFAMNLFLLNLYKKMGCNRYRIGWQARTVRTPKFTREEL